MFKELYLYIYIHIYIYIYIYINPASNNLGKVSKRILDDVNSKCRVASGVNQWKSTQDVLKWFSHAHSANPTKQKAKFLQFGICEFYPSITEELLRNSLDYAKSHTTISPEEEELIMSCRKSVLFNNGKVWTKKDKDFDVTMGTQDGAEIAELTGIYLLKQVNDYLASLGEKSEAGLYRDDGLIYLEHANGPLISKIEKALHRIFKQNQLKISMEQKGYTVIFLDVTLSTDGSHKPYKKPNNSLKYVNKASNHPPSILRNIHSSIQKRLNTISSSEVEFDEAKANAGYSAELKYDAEHNRTTRASRKRKRRIVWYNPPFSKNVATNIGREFFKLLQLHFPKQHPFHCIFNKNTVKLSYSCTTNMDNIVKAHNAKILSKDENPGDAKDCNCRDRTACPVANKCLTTNAVYKATVKYEDKTQYYVGMTENSFKTGTRSTNPR